MTSLANQLKRLALPQNDPNLLSRRQVVSLLFDEKDAASMDRSTFYALGCTGLEELLGIEPAFTEFQETLFNQASVTLERSVQSKKVNQKLDESISLFLTRLSPYFLLKPALKCLEWLIQRFHIHLYNPDCLIACVLPYHETKMFVKVIQLLQLNDATNRWNWLQGIQKPGVPLARSTLLTHCYKDLGFMDFICTMVTKSIKAYSGHVRDGGCAQLRVVFSFYASTIVPALEAVEKVTDTIIAKLLPFVQLGLKSALSDYKAATYMIVCQLAVKVVMEARLVEALAGQLCKSLCKAPVLARESLGCLLVLLQNQKEGVVGPKPFGYLCSVPSLVPTLQGIAAVHDVSPLLRYFLPHLIHSIMAQSDEQESEELLEKTGLLESVLQNLPLSNGLETTVAKVFLEDYLASGSQNQPCQEKLQALNRRMQPLVRLFESKYPGALGGVLEGHVGGMASELDKSLFHQFISLTMSSGKYKILANSDTSLMLSLNHPLPAIRNMAVDYLKEIFTSGQEGFDGTFLKDALLERMKDHIPEVVQATLTALELYIDHMDPEATVASLLSLLHRIKPSDTAEWLPVLKQAVTVLDNPRIVGGNADLRARIGWELLPFLVVMSPVPDSTELQISSCVAQTDVLSQNPFTQGWVKVLQDVLERTQQSDVLGVANQMLITTLTKNLAAMDPSTTRSTLERVCEVLGKLGSSGRESVAFVVLSCALQQALGALNESQHLHTAQRLYSLLEPALLQRTTSVEPQTCVSEVVSSLPLGEWLGVYLQQLQGGDRAEREHGLLLLSLLRSFILALKSTKDAFKDDPWWNLEKLDTNSCCYLRLLCRLFDIIISGASQGPFSPAFKSLLQPLLQQHLSNPLELFKFLSVLWGYGSNLGDQLECLVSVVLQTQALYVGRALLSVQPGNTLSLLASTSSPVVPTLLACLCSRVGEVRRAAVMVLQVLSGVMTSPYHALVERLLQTTEELISDPSYLSQALGKLYEECVSVKGKSKLLASVELLLQCVQSASCPSYTAKALLRALRLVNGEAVLASLLPAVERLLEQYDPDSPTVLADDALLLQLLMGKYNEQAAPLLARNTKCLELFVKAMGTSAQLYHNLPSIQTVAIGQITKPFFAALGDEKVQQRILGVMFDLLVESKSPVCAQSIGSVFKGIAVDAVLVANELSPAEKPKVSGTVQQTRRSQMLQKRPQEVAAGQPEEGAVCWPRVTLILELLQHKKKLKRAQALVPALFSLLSRSLEPSKAEQENLEYTKQLLLSCLLNICHKLAPQGGPISPDVLEEDKLNVELVVQCVRVSDVPQTHHYALLLLGAVAGIYPDKVLHNIMPIFTFMGANIMRLDDTYSFQVINKTVQTVIPALIKAHEGGGAPSEGQVECVVARIMHVFIDALPHVPEHRRLPILSQLLSTLGPARFLWVLMLLLFKQHATQTNANAAGAEKDAALERDVEFWISVCCEFEVPELLTSLIKILHYLMALPQEKDEGAERTRASTRKPQQKIEDLIFEVGAHSGKELRHFKFLSVSFMAQLLASNSFVGKMVECDVTDSTLQSLQQSLLEDVLRYIHAVARCVEDNADKPTAKFWRALLNKAYDVLDKVNALLPTDTFITVMRGLMGNELASVRRKAMELLNNKLLQRAKWQEAQVAVLLNLIGDLLTIVGGVHRQEVGDAVEEGAEQAINRQTALYSLKLLCRCFGANHEEAFVPVLSRAVELVASEEEEKNVMGSALLCVAEVTSTLKARAIPQIHRLMPAVLLALKKRKELLSNEVYLLSAVTALQRVSETLPHFISPYLQDTLTQVTRLTLVAKRLTSCPQLPVRLTSLQATLATKVPPRVLVPTIAKCYGQMVDSHQERLGPLMNILKDHIGHMEKEQLSSHQSELTSFFLSALDFRAKHCQGDLEKTKDTEGCVIDCVLVMVLKLSEVTFRPFFFKLFDWSKTDGAARDRLLTFYRLSDCIADRLKGLFVLFAGQLVKPLSDLLRQLNLAHTDEDFFGTTDDEDDDNVAKSCLLLQFLLDCLHKIFLYDTQRFLSKERADALLGPLVDQLENMLGGEETYQTRVAKHLVPCIGQFSVAMGDDSQWKVLNYQILLKTRHSSPKVRFSALVLLLELAGRLRENYVVLLPETIPFLAELMEDECEEVEHQVQKVIQEMESVLGEPLQSYF